MPSSSEGCGQFVLKPKCPAARPPGPPRSFARPPDPSVVCCRMGVPPEARRRAVMEVNEELLTITGRGEPCLAHTHACRAGG